MVVGFGSGFFFSCGVRPELFVQNCDGEGFVMDSICGGGSVLNRVEVLVSTVGLMGDGFRAHADCWPPPQICHGMQGSCISALKSRPVSHFAAQLEPKHQRSHELTPRLTANDRQDPCLEASALSFPIHPE